MGYVPIAPQLRWKPQSMHKITIPFARLSCAVEYLKGMIITMKAQFKYAFKAGISPRIYVFASIFVTNLTFIILGAFGILPFAAQVVGVSLSSTAIVVMLVFNVIGDASIINQMFKSPGAVFYSLTPAPRRERLLASVISMLVMDFVTMAVSIFSVVALSINLGSRFTEISIWEMIHEGMSYVNYPGVFVLLALCIAAYLYITMLIMFCKAIRKSAFFCVPAGGLLALLVAVGVLYVTNISSFLLAPFGEVSRFYFFFTITIGYLLGTGLFALLLFIFAAIMFILTSRIMERKMNI